MRISDWSSDVCSSDLTPMVPKAPAKEKSRQSFKDSQRRPKSIASSIWQKPKSKISSNQAHLIANARNFAFETYSPRLRLQKQPESVARSHLQSLDTSALEALASMADRKSVV